MTVMELYIVRTYNFVTGNASISAYLTILPLHRVTRPPTVTRPTFKSFTRVGFCLHLSQPTRAVSDSEWVTAFPTRYPPSVSTDRPGTGPDRILGYDRVCRAF